MEEVFEYNEYGRLKYHPELHARQGKSWTGDELEYLCKYHDIDELEMVSLALERVQHSCAAKLSQLRKTGLYEFYRNSNRFYESVS